MDIQCPYCGNVGSVDVTLTEGQPLRCPFCNQKFFFKASPQSAGQPDDSLSNHRSRPHSIAGLLGWIAGWTTLLVARILKGFIAIVKWAVGIFIFICIANAVVKTKGCFSDSGRREVRCEETEEREEGISQEDAIKMAYILGALSGANNANNANSLGNSGRENSVRSWSPPAVQPTRYDNNYESFANQGRMSESRNASAPESKRSYTRQLNLWACCYCHRTEWSVSRQRNEDYTCLSSGADGFRPRSCFFERVDNRR